MSLNGTLRCAATGRTAANVSIFAGVLLMLGVSLFIQSRAILNHDVGCVLAMARRLLEGGEFFTEVLDPNPPLVFWLFTVPHRIGEVMGASPVVAFRVLMFVTVAVSLGLVYVILVRQLRSDLVGASLIMVGLTMGLLVYGQPDFGLREHLMMVLAAPYIVTVATGGASLHPFVRLAVGCAAGVGFALKPQFLIIPVLLECMCRRAATLRTRLNPERTGIVTTLAVYGVALALFGRRYLFEVPPLVLSAYGGYDAPLVTLLRSCRLDVAMLSIAGLIALRESPVLTLGLKTFLVAGAATMVVYVWAGKGWSYQSYPLSVASFTCGVLAVGSVCRKHVTPLRARAGDVVLAGVMVGLTVVQIVQVVQANVALVRHNDAATTQRALAKVIESHAAGQPLYSLSTSVAPTFPAANYTTARWASRFTCLWWLPTVVNGAISGTPDDQKDAATRTALETILLDAVAEDLSRFRPVLILVDERPEKQGIKERGFNMLQYLSRDHRIALFLAEYEDIGAQAECG